MNNLTKKILIPIIALSLLAPYGVPFLIHDAYAISSSPQEPTDTTGSTESGSSIGDSLGSIGKSASSAVGSILSCGGGGIGSIAGKATGLISGLIGGVGGEKVPVEEKKIQRINKKIKEYTGAVKSKECSLDGLAVVARELLISSITRSIVNWINNGFDGEPVFITDLEGFLLDIGDQVIGEYIEGSELAFLCSPFQLDVRISLALDYYAEDRLACTLTGVLENIENAFGDFSSGSSWNRWFEFSINPHNNAYGSFIGSRQEFRESLAAEQGRQLRVVDWGNGIQSYEVCDTTGTQDPNNSANVTINTPIGSANCRIATPGVVINEQLGRVLGSGFQQLELADEINEIIGALLGQLANQVLGGSQGGLRGLSSSNYGRPTYVDQLVNSSEQNSETKFKDYSISIVDELISIENQYISAKNVSTSLLNISEDLLNSLSQCYADKLSTSQSPTLTTSERAVATERMNTASSTITTNITPLKDLITSDTEQAQDNISNLLVIKEDLINATSYLGVERILTNKLDIIRGDIHSQSDVDIAEQQKEDIGSITEAMDDATNNNLTTCESFPDR